MKALSFVAKGFLFLCLLSCVATSYTRDEEKQITNDLVNIVLGQFAHHGLFFYQNEELKNKDLLGRDSKNFQARNDLAVAQLKQKKWTEALENFKINEQLKPGHYETAINLGILYKKKGDLSLAIEHIERSLQIKPEGHMGLGNYYLKMVQWRHDLEKNGSELENANGNEIREPQNNFLAIPYSDSPEQVQKQVNKEFLIRLIKNDFKFSDAYVVLGDVLFAEKDFQLALRCYLRAQYLEHPSYKIINERISAIKQHWQENKEEGYVLTMRRGRYQINDEIANAQNWLIDFQGIEKTLIEKQLNADFQSTLKAMQKAGIARPTIIDAAYFKGQIRNNYIFMFLPYLVIPGFLLVLVVLYKLAIYLYELKVDAV